MSNAISGRLKNCSATLEYSRLFLDVLAKTQVTTGPTLFEVRAKWVLRNPTQFGSDTDVRLIYMLIVRTPYL